MKRYAVWILFAALAATAGTRPGAAQPGDEIKALRNEVETLKQGQSGIKKDLEEIKALLRTGPGAAPGQPAAAQDVPFDLNGAHVKGAKNAKVAMVEFSDFQ